MIDEDVRAIANKRLADLELRVSFGDHVEECNEFVSSSIESRVLDFHAAFDDTSVDAILTGIGGYNANQMLPHIDWSIIEANPKIFCGYSDITALSCAIYAQTGLVTYSGPHYSTFGMIKHFEQTLEWFTSALFDAGPIDVVAANTWTDDAWHIAQQERIVMSNEGHWVMQPGEAQGRLIGGNLCTLNLLQGTKYMPDITGTVLFIEDDFESSPATFDRDLTSLTQQRDFEAVQALLIGRFQTQVEMTREKLEVIIAFNQKLRGLPIVANVDFGHTDPLLTIPVGGEAQVSATTDGETKIVFNH